MPLEVRAARSGDVTSPFAAPPPAAAQPDFTDISAEVAKFKGDLEPSKVFALVRDNVPPVDAKVNFTDISAVVDAFKGYVYPYSGPCPCR